MSTYGETIYGTRGNKLPAAPWGVITAKDKKLFVHLLNKTNQPYLFIPGLKEQVIAANVFKGDKKVTWKQQQEGLFLYLDGVDQDEIDTVIELQVQ